jgi:hypothetical protein
MNQTDHLHDKGTDKLIADVRAFDPTKVNPGEQDEVPEAFDEFTGPCETRPAAPAKSEPFDWVPKHVDMSFRIGYRSGILDCINAVLTSHLSAADRCHLADAFAALKLPADTTRQG